MNRVKVDKVKKFLNRNWIWGALIIYLLFVVIYTISAIFSEGENRFLTSNELGDFLAGVFAPLAFLFLYLGYLQQGKELKQNTKALELQATELGNLVNAQKEEKESRDFSVQPFLSISKDDVSVGTYTYKNSDHDEIHEDYIRINFDLLFQGGSAKFIEILEPVRKEQLAGIYDLKANTSYSIGFNLNENLLHECVENGRVEFCIVVSYFGIYGAKYSNIVNITVYDLDINIEAAEIDLRLLGTTWN